MYCRYKMFLYQFYIIFLQIYSIGSGEKEDMKQCFGSAYVFRQIRIRIQDPKNVHMDLDPDPDADPDPSR